MPTTTKRPLTMSSMSETKCGTTVLPNQSRTLPIACQRSSYLTGQDPTRLQTSSHLSPTESKSDKGAASQSSMGPSKPDKEAPELQPTGKGGRSNPLTQTDNHTLYTTLTSFLLFRKTYSDLVETQHLHSLLSCTARVNL